MSTPTPKLGQDGTQSLKQDYQDLNKVKIPLAELRVQIVELMKDGFTEIPLADLLHLIKHTKDGV